MMDKNTVIAIVASAIVGMGIGSSFSSDELIVEDRSEVVPLGKLTGEALTDIAVAAMKDVQNAHSMNCNWTVGNVDGKQKMIAGCRFNNMDQTVYLPKVASEALLSAGKSSKSGFDPLSVNCIWQEVNVDGKQEVRTMCDYQGVSKKKTSVLEKGKTHTILVP
jgi:hypothetical protein